MKNEPAFPRLGLSIKDQSTGEVIPHDPGMTLRDYFAAKALQAIIREQGVRTITEDDQCGEQCFKAYFYADKMLQERDE